MVASPSPDDAMIAVMGATGTGKSTFIKLLTNDKNIVIGHGTESETSDITLSRYFNVDAGRSVILIDTPGFDDSRDGVTDTDILEKIVDFLQPSGGSGPGRKLNGIIYMHRISDPRMGGVSRKNLKMFRQLCGDNQLGNVRIVTTNWGRVSEKEGADREADLANSNTAFKPLIDAGAVLLRQDGTAQTAQSIISQLVGKKPVTMQIQEELKEGKTLGTTSAGAIITEDIERLQKKHEKEMASLKKEMKDAAKANDNALRAELAEERRVLEEKMARGEEDRTRLERTLDEARAKLEEETKKLHEMQKQAREEAARLREDMEAATRDRERVAQEMERARMKAEQERLELDRRSEEERRKHEKHLHDIRQAMKQADGERTDMQRKMKEAEDKATADNARMMAHLERERQEQMQRAEEYRSALQAKAEEAQRKGAELEEEIRNLEGKRKNLEMKANRGLFSRFLDDFGDVVEDCTRTGFDQFGFIGGLGGVMVGMTLAPVVSGLIAVLGK